MSTDDQHSKYTSNVSTESAVQLADFVESLEFENGEYHSSDATINQIEHFLTKAFNITSLVQIQSYCATTNDHTALTALNENLKSLIQFADTTPQLTNAIKPLIVELISSHNMKVFYRCFNNEHPSITIPAVNLLTAIVSFDGGNFVEQFLENFDLSLKSLADLLYPTKLSVRLSSHGKSHTTVRHYMSLFWIALCTNASPLTRNELLSNNKKINFNWIKFITEFDNPELIRKVLNFIDEKILNEPAFRKMTKCKLLGDFTLSKLVELYKNEDVKADVHKLLTKVTTDETKGLLFHDYRSWFKSVPLDCLPSGSNFNNAGVSISIGEASFKINNKIIYNVLTTLHPWSDSMQLKLAIQILSRVPELVAPYTSHLFHTNGAHDPKLTSFYIGQTLLLTKIIQLPIPEEFILTVKKLVNKIDDEAYTSMKAESYLSDRILMEVICPSPLNRSSLTKGFNANNELTKHLTAQLVISILQKFSKISKLLCFNECSTFTTLRNELQNALITLKLPDPTVLVGATKECLKAGKLNKLLLLNYMKAAECFHEVLDVNVSIQLGPFNNLLRIDSNVSDKNTEGRIISQAKLSDVELLLFNSYLTLTTNSSLSNQQSKWWNASSDSQNSIFTTIAKLPYDLQYKEDKEETTGADNALIWKSVEVLSNFLDDSLAFEDYKSLSSSVLESQAWAIVLSLLTSFNSITEPREKIIESICKTLDEAISRSIRAPYKYFDIVTEYAQKIDLKNSRLSAFFVALCEQSKFAKPEYLCHVREWINTFTIFMFILGEPLPTMKAITKEYYDFEVEFDLTTYESYLKSHGNLVAIGFSNFSKLCFTPWNRIKSKVSSIIPKSDIEIIAVLTRIKTLINSDIELNSIEESLFELVSLYGNYILQKYSTFVDDNVTINNLNLLQKKYWQFFFVCDSDKGHENEQSLFRKKCFVMDLCVEIFQSLWNNNLLKSDLKGSLRETVFDLVSNENLPEAITSHVAKYLWVLSDKQVLKLIVEKPFNNFNNSLIEIATERNLRLGSDEALDYCIKKNSNEIDADMAKQIASLLKNVKFTEDQTSTLVRLAKASQNHLLFFYILETICLYDSKKTAFIGEQLQNDFDQLSKSVEGFEFLQFISRDFSSYKAKLFVISRNYIQAVLDGNVKVDRSLNIYLKSIVQWLENFTEVIPDVRENISQLILLDSVRNDAELIFSPQMTSLVFILFGQQESDIFKVWLTRATLYITKVFAETSDAKLSQGFENFLSSLQKLFNLPMWKFVSKAMLNSQLEVILSKHWIKSVTVLKYTTWVIITGSKNVIECTKLVNILLNNPDNSLAHESCYNASDDSDEIKYYTSLALSLLCKMNVNKLATFDLVFTIAKLYKGTIRPCDLVLKDLLMTIEEANGESWIQMVSNWDLVDEWLPADANGESVAATPKITNTPDMIIDTPGLQNCLTVSLHKAIIDATVKNFDPAIRSIRLPVLERTIHSHGQDYAKLEEFYNHKKIDLEEIDGEVTYDCEFILLLIVNNDDLFKISGDTVKVNIRALISTCLLQLVICGLAHELNEIHEISKRIISSVILTVEDDVKKLEARKARKNEKSELISETVDASISTFKERSAFKVYLCNLLYTLEEKRLAIQSGEDIEPMPKAFIIFLSYLVPVLSNPAHFLYEKAYRYILGGSKYRDYELPLYKSIMVNFTRDEHTRSHNDDADYYKQLQWILRTLSKSITSHEDLKILRRNDVIEQLSNILNSPFVNTRIQESILEVFERIIRVENGADLLIRSFGLMSFVESKNVGAKKGKAWDKIAKIAMKAMIGSECNGKDKRAREWCSDDFGNVIKRICM